MALDNVKEYIDFMMDRFGEAETPGLPGRSRCLAWLQWSEDELWSGRPWFFRHQLGQGATVAGTAQYTTAAVTHELVQVRVDGGAPLTYVSPSLFRELCGSATSGAPRFWTQDAGNSSGNARFSVWPVPSSNGTFEVTYLSIPTTLMDSAGSQSAFPASHRMVVVYKALVRGLDHYNLGAARDLAMREFEQYYGALLMQDEQQPKVTR